MPSITVVFKNNKINSNGEAPLYLRIIKNRKPKYISLGYRIHQKYWDPDKNTVRPSHPDANELNTYISLKISEARKKILKVESKNNSISTSELKEHILGKESPSLFKYAKRYYDGFLEQGKIGTYKRYKSNFKKLRTYLKNKDILLEDITVLMLKDYERHMRIKHNNTQNTVHGNMRCIKRVINVAIEEGVFPVDKNPFIRYKPKREKVEKVYLTEYELSLLENVHITPGTIKEAHRDAFIFACYAGGMRISDICKLQWKNFDGQRIIMATQKTGSMIIVKLPNKALDIINKFKKRPTVPENYIFPFLKTEEDYSIPRKLHNAISSTNSLANKNLKIITPKAGIDKHISFHTSRHTWATRALRKGMRIEYVSKIMGHTSIKTTQVYAKIVDKELEDAMDVFND
ncbi:MAG: site-specific integrase [Bacteroidetes bacterium]|nr:site-specific integrase [Bacteroidota bacterium]